jgi:hypothetical protein
MREVPGEYKGSTRGVRMKYRRVQEEYEGSTRKYDGSTREYKEV